MSELSLEAFREAVKRPGSRCTVAKIREALDPKTRAVLDAALADESITAPAIAEVLSREGHAVKSFTIGGHRRGDCACPKEEA